MRQINRHFEYQQSPLSPPALPHSVCHSSVGRLPRERMSEEEYYEEGEEEEEAEEEGGEGEEEYEEGEEEEDVNGEKVE